VSEHSYTDSGRGVSHASRAHRPRVRASARHLGARSTCIVLSVLSLIGCATPTDRAGEPSTPARAGDEVPSITRRDSAGIRLVENPALADSPVRFRLGTEPTLDVGGLDADPELEFNAQRGELWAVPLRNGGLGVLDITRVQLFSRTGVRERVIGRAGGGPDEFRALYSGCGLIGDTLVVIDGQLSRIVTLSPDGAFLQRTQHDDARAVQRHPCFGDGTLLVKRTVARRDGAEDVELVRLHRDGTLVNRIAQRTDVPTRDMVTQAGVSLAASGRVAYFGDGASGDIHVFGHQGGLVRIMRTRDRLVAITPQEMDEELGRVYPRGVFTGDGRERAIARARARTSRTTWPVYAQVVPSDDGRVWVQHYRRLSLVMNSPFAGESWTAFDSLGRMEGRFVLSAPALRDRAPPRVVAFMRGGVLLLRRDDDGAPHFTLYPLVRTGVSSTR